MRILDVETVWNHTVYQVWILRRAIVEWAPAVVCAKTAGLGGNGYDIAAAACLCELSGTPHRGNSERLRGLIFDTEGVSE